MSKIGISESLEGGVATAQTLNGTVQAKQKLAGGIETGKVLFDRKTIATKTELGCIIVGDGLCVRDDGTTYLQYQTGSALTNLEIEAICR